MAKSGRLAGLFLVLVVVLCIETGLRLRDRALVGDKQWAQRALDVALEARSYSRKAPWPTLNAELIHTQSQRLSKMTESAGPGHFRAASLEALGEMCQREEILCSVSLANELDAGRALGGAEQRAARVTSTSAGPSDDSVRYLGDQLIVSTLRVQLTLRDDALPRFVSALAREPITFAVTRFNVRGPRAEFFVRGIAKRTAAAVASADDSPARPVSRGTP